jgi:tetratricopeptide (TPR) repeat protein
MKPGRNDPCPCGSGKKYKKCCIPNYDKPVATPTPPDLVKLASKLDFLDLWMPEMLNRMSDAQILSKLEQLGIPLDRDSFVKDIREQLSAEKVAKLWQERYQLQITGKDADFPYCAAVQLSRRWAPELYTIEKLEDLADELNKRVNRHADGILEMYQLLWSNLKECYIIPFHFRSFDQMHEHFSTMIDYEWVIDDYAHELRNSALYAEDSMKKSLLNERIALYREMLDLLPDTLLHNKLNWRRNIAESYELLGDYAQAEQDYEALTREHPNWAWGYVGWGDMLRDRAYKGDFEKAETIYRLGLKRVFEDKDVLEERLETLKSL